MPQDTWLSNHNPLQRLFFDSSRENKNLSSIPRTATLRQVTAEFFTSDLYFSPTVHLPRSNCTVIHSERLSQPWVLMTPTDDVLWPLAPLYFLILRIWLFSFFVLLLVEFVPFRPEFHARSRLCCSWHIRDWREKKSIWAHQRGNGSRRWVYGIPITCCSLTISLLPSAKTGWTLSCSSGAHCWASRLASLLTGFSMQTGWHFRQFCG